MRWTLLMAEAMLRLRAVYLSEHFEEYRPFHVDRDQKRLFQSVKSVKSGKLVAKK